MGDKKPGKGKKKKGDFKGPPNKSQVQSKGNAGHQQHSGRGR